MRWTYKARFLPNLSSQNTAFCHEERAMSRFSSPVSMVYAWNVWDHDPTFGDQNASILWLGLCYESPSNKTTFTLCNTAPLSTGQVQYCPCRSFLYKIITKWNFPICHKLVKISVAILFCHWRSRLILRKYQVNNTVLNERQQRWKFRQNTVTCELTMIHLEPCVSETCHKCKSSYSSRVKATRHQVIQYENQVITSKVM